MRCLRRRSSITLILTVALAIAATGAIGRATSEAAAPSGMRLPFVGHVYYYTTAYHTGNMKYARDVVPKPTNAWNGTVVAMAAGKVILAEGRDVTKYCPFAPNGRQREVRIEHSIGGKRYMTVYTHLSSYSVRVGQKVSGGQVIGSYGRAGCADGKHLHFEVHSGGTFGNPWSGTNISVDDLPGVKSVGSGPGTGDAVGPAVSSNAVFNWLLGPGDFTGDWCEDIIGRRPDGTLRLYEGNCAGGWGRQNVQIGTGWNGFNWILGPGDFDGDTRTDVIARKPDGTLWLYRGNGSGGWITGRGEKIGTGWGAFNWLLGPSDFTGDGCADVIGRRADRTLRLYEGNCAGGWSRQNVVIGTGW